MRKGTVPKKSKIQRGEKKRKKKKKEEVKTKTIYFYSPHSSTVSLFLLTGHLTIFYKMFF